MTMKIITKTLLFLSNTDEDVIVKCTKRTINQQIALGAFVLFTGIFAFMSGSYAVSHLFAEYDYVTKETHISGMGIIYSILIGLTYALFIMQIDREIVSTVNKKAAALRIPLAIIIGLVIALPIELKLVEGRIEKQLFQNSQRDN